MIAVSRLLFGLAFAGYLTSVLLYVARLTLRQRAAGASPAPDRLGPLAFALTAVGVGIHGAGIIARWVGSGQAPMSNLHEYLSLTGWSVMLFFVLITRRYRVPSLGAFLAPVGVIVIAYASVFPAKVASLVPALQSYWLVLHVAMAALGEGAFALSFAAALMYVLRARQDCRRRWEDLALEGLSFLTAALVGFIALALVARLRDLGVELAVGGGGGVTYHLPPLVGPAGAAAGSAGHLAGLTLPLWSAPDFMGAAAARKLNTLVLSLIMGGILYGLARLLARKPLCAVGTRAVAGLRLTVLDDISYRAVAVGFPLFTLGALVFGMIWAQKAWGSYWSWDPKETWALISWLFYAGYLHQRIVRRWQGRPAAWTAITGFVVVMFTLVGVNLLISGLHSYAGG